MRWNFAPFWLRNAGRNVIAIPIVRFFVDTRCRELIVSDRVCGIAGLAMLKGAYCVTVLR
jgi:hypothetical protein